MLPLADFKKAYGIDTLSFYKSKESNRHVAGFGKDNMLITTADFDPKKPAFCYENPKDADGTSWILSNKEPREADFTL